MWLLNGASAAVICLMRCAFHLVTDNALLAQFAPMLEPIVGNLICWFINEVTFNPDGNITARYATMPEGKAIGDLIQLPPNRQDSEWISSPINLASYYVKDDSELYIVPNIDMILYQIEQNKPTEAWMLPLSLPSTSNLTNGVRQVSG